MEKDLSRFQVSVYGDLTPFDKNPLLSLARVRIFYKGLNRNKTFITDEFAEKLIESLPYTPVSGIWEDGDFTDHGESREEGRIYGLVPENPNVKYEIFKDDDGIEREYVCCDVVLFTTRYEKAKDIVGKAQSMELYKKSIKGEWMTYENTKCYKFIDGCFIGLQVLGNDTEPCFEGAAFYSYSKSLQDMINILRNYNLNKGESTMINFKLSDREKFDALWTLLNPNYNEEGDFAVDCNILDIYDDYALVQQCDTKEYFRISYKKCDESDSVELGAKCKVYILDISENELAALNALRAINGGNFELMDSKYQTLIDDNSTLIEEKEKFEVALNNSAEVIKTLNEQVEEKTKECAECKEKAEKEIAECKKELAACGEEKDKTISELETALKPLKEFKAEYDRNIKLEEIVKYTMLDAEVIDQFTADVDNYSLEDLTRELKIAYVNANAATIFAKQDDHNGHLIPNEYNADDKLSGAAKLINQHKKHGGKF